MINGRYPGPNAPAFVPENIVSELRIEGGVLKLRLDDSVNSDFWMGLEIPMPESDMSAALERLRVIKEMCSRAPIMLALVESTIASLEGQP